MLEPLNAYFLVIAKTIKPTRDVVFHEGIFPLNPVSSQTTPAPVPLPPSYADSDDDTSPQTFPLLLTPFILHLWTEPQSYFEASKDARWIETMNEELIALDKNETWELVPLQPGKRAIGSKWVFKLKLNQDGSVQCYKARLVAKCYNEIEGIDYFDRFSPVTKSVTMRVFLAVAVAKGWPLWQLDVNNAFLDGHLDEEVFVTHPESYVPIFSGHCPHDHCLFLKVTSTCFVGLLVYVDDILLTGNPEDEIAAVKGYIHSLFTIKDLGFAKYFVGLELACSAHGLLVTQQKYLTNILKDANLLEAMIASTPLPLGFHIVDDAGSLSPDPGPFRWFVGFLPYLGFTRPDISFIVQQLSQFLQHPRFSHWDVVVHILRYLKDTSTLGLFFPSSNTLQPSVLKDAS
ncbi:UNVERIFIED_CONTAM: Retrovirus-related Pol polyprotein from transposon RE2 [Sesamum angustifolium]|uniref:Retrovirus-related Pol polyprotein from transposon RE2 n=1 Tax=Sesamum angustifolium TaxID=2727405 RepID=A0AAW2P338_9LAMI